MAKTLRKRKEQKRFKLSQRKNTKKQQKPSQRKNETRLAHQSLLQMESRNQKTRRILPKNQSRSKFAQKIRHQKQLLRILQQNQKLKKLPTTIQTHSTKPQKKPKK
jgi:hypothetical protein